ncbi:MAG TPA: polyketide cyclase [Bacteroidetes bacterium]|nr:polyketide cyclase [Bacteroidota bacterium]
MKILKYALFTIIGIIALGLITAAVVKSDYAVTREVTISKPKQQVFDYIKFIGNQDNYSVWNNKDPKMKKEKRGTDGTVGFVASWDSEMKDVGKGEQEIKAIKDGERIDMELRFMKPFTATDNAFMTTEALDSTTTKVQWGFNGKMPYPMNLMLLFMNMDKMLGDDLQKGLDNLKVVMEK